MRSVKSGLVAVTVAALFASAAVIACSADGGSSDVAGDQAPTDPSGDNGAVLPPPSQGGSSSGTTTTDAGKKDSGKTDAGYDAGPPPPTPGDACTTLNEIRKKACGACGQASTVCLATGAESATGTWSGYSPCENELAGGCTPGTVVNEACGNCGTVTKTCTQYCAFTSGACTGQPLNSCVPATTDYSSAGCTTPGTYRNRTCAATCTWNGYSTACTEPNNPNKMTISATLNGVVTQAWALAPATQGKRIVGSCPATGSASTTANYQYVAIEVHNPTAQTATISAYHTKTATGVELDTLMWVYKKILPPQDDASLEACDLGVEDGCSSVTGSPCGGGSLNFAGVGSIVIPPNGKVLVYSSGYSSTVTGAFNMNLRTDSLM